MASPLVLQPDAAAGKDAWLYQVSADENFGTYYPNPYVGCGGEAGFSRIPIAFDISPIPAGSIITAATLSMWEYTAGGAYSEAVELRRVLRNWIEAEVTWNSYSTGQAWATAGCGGATDRVATASASLTMDGTAAAGFVSWSGAGLVADAQGWLDGTFANYGWLVSCPAKEVLMENRYNRFYSSDYATDAAKRPKLVVEYRTAPRRSIGSGIGSGIASGIA